MADQIQAIMELSQMKNIKEDISSARTTEEKKTQYQCQIDVEPPSLMDTRYKTDPPTLDKKKDNLEEKGKDTCCQKFHKFRENLAYAAVIILIIVILGVAGYVFYDLYKSNEEVWNRDYKTGTAKNTEHSNQVTTTSTTTTTTTTVSTTTYKYCHPCCAYLCVPWNGEKGEIEDLIIYQEEYKY